MFLLKVKISSCTFKKDFISNSGQCILELGKSRNEFFTLDATYLKTTDPKVDPWGTPYTVPEKQT